MRRDDRCSALARMLASHVADTSARRQRVVAVDAGAVSGLHGALSPDAVIAPQKNEPTTPW